MTESVMLTKEGFEKIKAKHKQLVTVERKAVAEKLKVARAFGDLSENAEYNAAKNIFQILPTANRFFPVDLFFQ